jgi:putative SOS response-associated peptidase YedK
LPKATAAGFFVFSLVLRERFGIQEWCQYSRFKRANFSIEYFEMRHWPCVVCNRYAHKIPREEWKLYFGVEPPELPLKEFERYNVAPSQSVPAIIERNRKREFTMLTWGFVLYPDTIGVHFNARSEKASQSYTFGAAFQSQRCILPASGFYEWKHGGGKPQPWYFYAEDGMPLALGAIFNRETVAILTTAANKPVARLHNRMPVLLHPKDFDRWLDTRPLSGEEILTYCVPAPESYLTAHAVSPLVNNVRNDGAELHKPPNQLQGELF